MKIPRKAVFADAIPDFIIGCVHPEFTSASSVLQWGWIPAARHALMWPQQKGSVLHLGSITLFAINVVDSIPVKIVDIKVSTLQIRVTASQDVGGTEKASVSAVGTCFIKSSMAQFD